MRYLMLDVILVFVLNKAPASLAAHFQLIDRNVTGYLIKELRCSRVSCALKCQVNPLCQYSGFIVRQKEEICLLVGVTDGGENMAGNVVVEFTKFSVLRPGDGNSSSNPGFSCNQIKKDYPDASSGRYWLQLSKPITVYCDMEVDGGGWLLVGHVDVTFEEQTKQLTFSSSENALSFVKINNILLDGAGLKKLQGFTRFNQLRIFCSKGHRVLHLKTNQSQKGYDIIDYITMRRDTCPSAIGAFQPMPDDDSVISRKLDVTGHYKDGHVGFCIQGNLNIINRNHRLYNHILFYPPEARISLLEARKECDDYTSHPGYQQNGLWKFYVR